MAAKKKQPQSAQDFEGTLCQLLEQGKREELVALVLGSLQRLAEDNEKLKREIAKLRRLTFGRKTEKISEAQLKLALDGLGDQVPVDLKDAAQNDDEQEAPKDDPSRKKKGGRRKRRGIPETMPRKIKEITIPAEERQCCEQTKNDIGYTVSWRVEYEPAKFFVIEERKHKYACAVCEEGVQQATTTPKKPLDGGRPGCSLLADLVAKKYADHLPLHRIQRIYTREGYDIPQSTLVDWIAAVATILEPLACEILCQALDAGVLQTDDTGVVVLDLAHEKKRKKGHLWIYLGDQKWVAFDFTPDWTAERTQQLLEGREGPIQADGYKGYDQVFNRPDSKAIAVGCHFHARSGFFDASKDDSRAFIAIGFYKQLYAVEREAKDLGLSHEQRRDLRQAKSKPVIDAFAQWMTEIAPQAPPKTPLGKAIRYAARRWEALSRFLDDGRLEIDNVAAERILKHVATGRRNWLFCGSDTGGARAATLYTLVCTCIACGIEPRIYLEDVLVKLAAGWKASRLHELLPPFWNEKAMEKADAQEPLTLIIG